MEKIIVKMSDIKEDYRVVKIFWLKGPRKDSYDLVVKWKAKELMEKGLLKIVSKKKMAISQPLIRALDEWLRKTRLDYYTPRAEFLWELFKKYDFKYFLELLCRRPGARLKDEGDAGRIWKMMQDLLWASPKLY